MWWENKVHLIAYFLGNSFAKNYRNQAMCVKIIASQRWDVFLRHGVVNSLSLAESFDYSQCTFTAKCVISILQNV